MPTVFINRKNRQVHRVNFPGININNNLNRYSIIITNKNKNIDLTYLFTT